MDGTSDQRGGEPGPPSSGVRRGRLLVVDDEAAMTRLVQRVLGPDHDVTGVHDGQEALALLVADRGFDVILCDLTMPVMSGMDLHAEVERLAPELASRFVFLTGGAFTAQARDFLERVPNLRLDKPFEAGALRALVRELVAAPGAARVASP